MTEKRLGKIVFAEYGKVKDYPFLIGLQLGFEIGGCGVFDGGKHTVNIGKVCKWERDADRNLAVTKTVEAVNEILKAANANYVSDLIGKPVEVTIENYTFKDFRILTEVL